MIHKANKVGIIKWKILNVYRNNVITCSILYTFNYLLIIFLVFGFLNFFFVKRDH